MTYIDGNICPCPRYSDYTNPSDWALELQRYLEYYLENVRQGAREIISGEFTGEYLRDVSEDTNPQLGGNLGGISYSFCTDGTIRGNLQPVKCSTISGGFLDEDNFISDASAAAASQQSTKAYIGTYVAAQGFLTDISDDPTPRLGAALDGDGQDISHVNDVSSIANLHISGAFQPTTCITNSGGFLDEDTFASDSSSAVPSQQSVNAHINTHIQGYLGCSSEIILNPHFEATTGWDTDSFNQCDICVAGNRACFSSPASGNNSILYHRTDSTTFGRDISQKVWLFHHQIYKIEFDVTLFNANGGTGYMNLIFGNTTIVDSPHGKENFWTEGHYSFLVEYDGVANGTIQWTVSPSAVAAINAEIKNISLKKVYWSDFTILPEDLSGALS